jgi:hypothetical protein
MNECNWLKIHHPLIQNRPNPLRSEDVLAVGEIEPERKPDDHRFSLHIPIGHKSPETAVVREVAVVSHAKETIRWHRDGAKTIGRIRARIEHDPVGFGVEMLVVNFEARLLVLRFLHFAEDRVRGFCIEFHMLKRFAVHVKCFFFQLNGVARSSDDTLDEIDAFVFRIFKYDNVATFGRIAMNEGQRLVHDPVAKRKIEAVGKLVHENIVARQKSGDHGARRDLESFDHARADREDDEQGEKERKDIFQNALLAWRRCGSFCLISLIDVAHIFMP